MARDPRQIMERRASGDVRRQGHEEERHVERGAPPCCEDGAAPLAVGPGRAPPPATVGGWWRWSGRLCVALCTGLVIGGAAPGGRDFEQRPLGVTIASYAGDAVTTTPSESAPAGSDVTYQVTVSNTGAAAQTNVSVPVDLPANFTLDASTATASAGTTTTAGGVLTWSIPSLAGGASATLTYTETTDAPAALESDATSASATSDQSATAASASASVEVVPVADLTVGVTRRRRLRCPGGLGHATRSRSPTTVRPRRPTPLSRTLSTAPSLSPPIRVHRRDHLHRPRGWPIPVDRRRPPERRQRDLLPHGHRAVVARDRQRVRERWPPSRWSRGSSTPTPSYNATDSDVVTGAAPPVRWVSPSPPSTVTA